MVSKQYEGIYYLGADLKKIIYNENLMLYYVPFLFLIIYTLHFLFWKAYYLYKRGKSIVCPAPILVF